MSTQTQSAASPLPTLAALKLLPRPVWILFIGSFLNKFGTFVIPFLTIYLTRQGYSVAQAGTAIAAYGVGQLLAALSGGHLADTFGRRKTIVLSMFSVAAVMVVLSQARGLPAIILLTGLAGWTGEIYRPASAALLADLSPPNARVTAYSAYRLAFNAGWAFGPATAGFLAAASYFWLFIGDALTSVLFGLVAWTFLPQGVRSTVPEKNWREAFRVIWKDRHFRRMLVAQFLASLLYLQMVSTYSLYVKALGFSNTVYGILLSLNGVLIVLFELPLTGLTQRFPPRRAIALGYLLLGIGFAANAFAHSVPALVVAMMIFTLGEMVNAPVTTAYVAGLAPSHLRGRYLGALSFSGALAHVMAPGVGMTLFQYSPPLLWLGCGALGLIASLVMLTDRDETTVSSAAGGRTGFRSQSGGSHTIDR